MPPPVILGSEGDEESLGRVLGQEGRFFAALRMTMGCAQNDRGEYVILRSGPVILGSGAFPPPLSF